MNVGETISLVALTTLGETDLSEATVDDFVLDVDDVVSLTGDAERTGRVIARFRLIFG